MLTPQRFALAFGVVYLALAAWAADVGEPEFRPWEKVKVKDGMCFVPDQRIAMREMGDLAYRNALRALDEGRETTFTTDSAGFRNLPGIEAPSVVVLGDSYVAGSSLRDDETLAVQLGQALGETTYSVACQTPNSPSLYLSEPRFAKTPPRAVVFAPSNRNVQPFGLFSVDWRALQAQPKPVPTAERIRDVIASVERDNGISRRVRSWYADVSYRLRGHPEVRDVQGAPALVMPAEAQLCDKGAEERALAEVVASLVTFRDALAQQGVGFVFMPVPDPVQVYPELLSAEEEAVCDGLGFFDALTRSAADAGIEVVDLRALYAANSTPYLYRRDDSHWTPHAVGLAAEALSARLATPPDRPSLSVP
ncbi:MAG: hypothetical protein KDA24_06265 [Deltaproteobacteria bacterium]|nr:hypothetical protein [Deltaproteobacteria bacterium]